MIIAVSGLTVDPQGNKGSAGSGKSTVTDRIVEKYRFVDVAFADAMKRFLREVLDFSEEQLWGPSELRNAPDARYPRPTKIVYPQTPRGAVWIPLSKGRGHTLIDAEDYDAVSQFKWRLNAKPGRRTDYVNGDVHGCTVKLHQFLLPDVAPGLVIDHINGDGLDNRRVNLRVCTQAENHGNEHKRAGGTSVFKGVSYDSDRAKWSAKICVSGETQNLGRFDNEVDAAGAYDKAARTAFGVHARLNADMFLTARHALQTLGTDWARSMCYPDIWVAHAMRVAHGILHEYRISYDRVQGLQYLPSACIRDFPPGVVFSDMRFRNEFDYVKKNGGKVIRVVRPVAELTIGGMHQSENDLNDIPDGDFDYVLRAQADNLPDLLLRTDEMMDWLKGNIRAYDETCADIPPFLRDMGSDVGSLTYNPRAVRQLDLGSGQEKDRGVPCCELDTDFDGNCPIHPRK